MVQGAVQGSVEGDLGCYQVCFEGDPSAVQTQERWAYVGEGRGSYSQETNVEYVGGGKGNLEKQVSVSYGAWRVRVCCIGLIALAILSILGVLLYHYLHRAPGSNPIEEPDCFTGLHDWQNLWNPSHQAFCCDKYGRGCPDHTPRDRVVVEHVRDVHHQPGHIFHVPVPMRPETRVVYKTHYVQAPPHVIVQHDPAPPPPRPEFHYDCNAGFSNWYFGWSVNKKSWCCDNMRMGCPGSWHGSYHLHVHSFAHGVGHAQGRIYDCNAGFSRWMTGWSDSKKDWCCHHQSRGCVKFHCTAGGEDAWAADKRSWCCENFQKGCPHTTLSALKCQASCTHAGETSKCIDRIHWTKEHVFGNKANGCELAYSKVQVECDICRGCSIQDGQAVQSMLLVKTPSTAMRL
ncbi:Uncharacterized protein SCF082_LOCUS16697 [Durusdinium trenchii]|uniref:Uncharacterized protein n=1 Tax=Durusdinium trenchii TaxID=1381693 RepID=A0ABP0KEA8_9DINO